MRLIKITNVKQFMNKMLIDTAFDSFLISEAVIKTFNSFIIDGHINEDFYSNEELSELAATAAGEGRIYSRKLSRWHIIKPTVLSLIKGKKTPSYFKMSFYLAEENINKLLSSFESSITANDIEGLSMIVKYDNNELTVTSSATLKIFTLDKSLEKYWDEMVFKFLSSNDIQLEVL